MESKNNQKLNRLCGLAAFCLPVFLLLVTAVVKGFYPFGEKCFLTGDLYHQYYPFFEEFYRKIHAGEGLDFSYHVGIGSNFLALYVYYLASPLHWIGLLLPQRFLIEFIGIIIILKTGLCSLTANYYLRKHFDTVEFGTVLFGILYAFCGFMTAYNYNIMWLDCVWLLPLILLGLEKLVKEGKPALYCISLAFSIYTNYYLSIMVCLFLILYFAYLFAMRGKKKGRAILQFAIYSLLAGGMAGVLLVPEVCAILQTDFGEISFPKKLENYFSIFDMLARHCLLVSPERGLDHWPNIFCGSAALFLIPMYALNRRISIREKLGKFVLIGIFLLAFSVNFLNFIWHGLNYPDSLPARQSFIYCFLVLVMMYEAYRRAGDEEPAHILYGFLIGAAFLVLCQKLVTDDAFEKGVFLLTLVFMVFYAILLYLYRTKEDSFQIICIAVVALVGVLAECGISNYDGTSNGVNRQEYVEKQADMQEVYKLAKEQTKGFFRMEKFSRKTKNDGTYEGIPTASVFSSTLNSHVMDMYTRLGMRHSKVYYSFEGATPFTQALLNVNYMTDVKSDYESPFYEIVGTSGDVKLYSAKYILPFGYVAPVGYDLPEEGKAISLQNKMTEALGVEQKLFTRCTKSITDQTIAFTADSAGAYYGVVTKSGTTTIREIGGRPANLEFTNLKINCIISLGFLEEGQSITLSNGDDKDTTPDISVEIYRLEENVLSEVLERLSENHLENVEYDSDHLRGELTLTEPGRLIMSLPYEDGFVVKCNGERITGEKFADCLMAFDLEAGQYEITCEYIPKGKYAGMGLSGGSILLFVLITLWKKRRNKKQLKEAANVAAEGESI